MADVANITTDREIEARRSILLEELDKLLRGEATPRSVNDAAKEVGKLLSQRRLELKCAKLLSKFGRLEGSL